METHITFLINLVKFVSLHDALEINVDHSKTNALFINLVKGKGKAVPLQALEWHRGFQEVKVPRFHDNGTG